MKWAAGRRFVLQHSARKIQTMTADFMETYNPAPDDPGLAWRVSKEPSADDKTFQIVAQAWCDNLFGCVPDAMQTMQRFNFEVTRAWRPTP